MYKAPNDKGPDWMSRSREVAEKLGHHFIAPEHIFLALANAKETAITNTLTESGLNLQEAGHIVDQIMQHVDPGVSGKNIPLTRAATELLKHAYLESRSRKADAIDARDVLLAMLQDGQGIIAKVIKQLSGVGYKEIKAMI